MARRVDLPFPYRRGAIGGSFFGAAYLAILLAVSGCASSSSPTNSTPVNTTPQVTVSGAGQVRLGSTAQLTATVTNETNTAVTWAVNGITGGSAAVGTISTTGLYTPPASMPATNPVTITAVSVAAPTLVGAAVETIWNPSPAVTTATVSQTYGATTGTLIVAGTGFVTGSQIQAAGTSITTTFVSSTQLQATVAGLGGSSVGTTIAVTVVNPNPGGSTSPTANAQVQASVQSAARLLLPGHLRPHPHRHPACAVSRVTGLSERTVRPPRHH